MNSRLDPFPAPARAPSRRMAVTEDADRVDVRGIVRSLGRRYRLLAACFFGGLVLFFAVASLLPPVHTASAKVMLDPRKVQILPTQDVVSNLNLSEPVILGEISLIRSNLMLGAVVQAIGLDRLETHYYDAPRPERSAEERVVAVTNKIRKDLKVTRAGDSYVIAITFSGGEPGLVMDVTNTIAQTYIDAQLDGRRASAREATLRIQVEVDELAVQVEEAEAAVAAFRAERLERDGGSIEAAGQQLANLSAQLIAARSERVAAEARYDQLYALVTSGGFAALSQAVTSPLVERLNEERLELVREDAVWARTFGTDHPQRQRIREEIARLDAELAAEASKLIDLQRNEVEVAKMREASLQDGIQDLESRMSDISSNALGLRQLEREAEAARRNYEALLNRLSETRSQEQLQQAEARLIEQATWPGLPSSPKPKLLGAAGGVLGLAAGLAAALFLEMTRPTFRTRQEVENDTGLPVISWLPELPKGDLASYMRALRGNSNTVYGERIRHLRTFLLMRNGRDEARAVMIVSSNPDEGKSTTALALAQMAALAGRSVILIDGDLRRSRMAAEMGWQMDPDFADFIQFRADLSQIIHTDEALGIDVLGPARPCPEAADRLSTSWLEPVMTELKRVYDVVIIDAPPLSKVSDGLVLARVADSIVYVVEWDRTPRSVVREGLDTLAEMRLGVTGVVLNKVDPKALESAYGKGYGNYA